jgi:hypothetical protein
MTKNPLEKAVESAVRANHYLGSQFAKMGNAEHPNGVIVSAYRVANRAMAKALEEDNQLLAAREVLRNLRSQVSTGINEIFRDAEAYGIEEAVRQLSFYDVTISTSTPPPGQSYQQASTSVLAQFDAEVAAIESYIIAGLDPVLITGDQNRSGLLTAGKILADTAFWATTLLWASFFGSADRYGGADQYDKQAVAVLDMRTTDCCLQVHGQVKPYSKPFHLTGTPRFADDIDWSPFHWRCRTSIVLYSSRYDDGVTDRMRAGAKYVLDQRANGKQFDQHPADAFVPGI